METPGDASDGGELDEFSDDFVPEEDNGDGGAPGDGGGGDGDGDGDGGDGGGDGDGGDGDGGGNGDGGDGDGGDGDGAARATPATRRRIIVPPEERVTSHQMTLEEMTRAIAIRAEQISKNPTAYTEIGDLADPEAIAEKEFRERKSPLNLYRDVGWTARGERITEVWAVREMAYPPPN